MDTRLIKKLTVTAHLYKALFTLMTCAFFQNGFCQNANILKLPVELNNIRVGKKLDTTNFVPIRTYSFKEALDKILYIYKIDYVYLGEKAIILDSVKVENLLIGTNKEGVIQSIIISCKNNPLLRNYFLLTLGHYAIISSSTLDHSNQKTEIWQKEGYCLSINTSTRLTGIENNTLITLFDSDYTHLFRSELMNSISTAY